jgi:phage-related baseplate assembly protein
MGAFSVIDLERLIPPDIVETLNYEDILQLRVADLVEKLPEYNALVETDPAIVLLQVSSAQELVLRQRMNDVARALLLAKAIGSDLDHISATYYGVERLEGESDVELRLRTQLSLEARTTAGTRGSYIFHALSADAEVKDVEAITPNRVVDPNDEIFNDIDDKLLQSVTTGQDVLLSSTEAALIRDSWDAQGHVYVTILARTGSGQPTQTLLDTVLTKLNTEDIRPLTDFVHVQAPTTIYEYEVEANLYFYDGPDPLVVEALALETLQTYVTDNHKLGHDIVISGIHAALHQAGVQRVELLSPTANIVVAPSETAYCTNITLHRKGIDE